MRMDASHPSGGSVILGESGHLIWTINGLNIL